MENSLHRKRIQRTIRKQGNECCKVSKKLISFFVVGIIDTLGYACDFIRVDIILGRILLNRFEMG